MNSTRTLPSLFSLLEGPFVLAYEHEQNAVVFRINGIVIARCANSASYGDMMLEVLRAIRRYHPALSDYNAAFSLWCSRVEPRVLTFHIGKDARHIVTCRQLAPFAFTVGVHYSDARMLPVVQTATTEMKARIIFERVVEELSGGAR